MAGFDSLGGNSFGNIGNISGQSSPAGYGIQPPTASFQAPSQTLSGGFARSAPTSPASFYQGQSTFGVNPDTSGQHQANVAMEQAGLGQLGLQGYRGFSGDMQGTSNSGYGFSPYAWSDINAYLNNPLGTWHSAGDVSAASGINPDGSIQNNYTIPYGQVASGGVAPNNTSRYQQIIDTIGSQMSNMWPSNWQDNTNYPGMHIGPQMFPNYSNQTIRQMAADLPLQYAGAYNISPPTATQMPNIAPSAIPGIRSFG
jgi:hypothetical protein